MGGKPIDGAGNFFEATILENIEESNPAWYEEFLPVSQLYVAKDDDEIVKIANQSHYT